MRIPRIALVAASFGLGFFVVAKALSQDAQPGGMLDGLAAEPELARLFAEGKEVFEEVETPADGLGPFFNAAGCAECHAHPATGGVAPPARPELRELRIGRTDHRGRFDPMLEQGGPVLHRLGLGDLPRTELAKLPVACRQLHGTTVPPREAEFVSFRQTTPLFGAGLIEAIPAEEILRRVNSPELARWGISGRPNLQGLSVGRFGWKSQQASLLAFAGEAYLVEMGITNPLAPTEAGLLRGGRAAAAVRSCDSVSELEDDGVDVLAFANFMRFLAPPSRGPITPQVTAGEALFRRAGCDHCHVPEMQTGPSSVAALDRQPVRLYSDLLLHDVGTGDGIEQGAAKGNEFRTSPLWGLRHRSRYLHDGRATDLLETIHEHRGEATRSSGIVRGFDATERAALAAFLRSL
jgi:CxxC motif-containing protein (DUF1111 family)